MGRRGAPAARKTAVNKNNKGGNGGVIGARDLDIRIRVKTKGRDIKQGGPCEWRLGLIKPGVLSSKTKQTKSTALPQRGFDITQRHDREVQAVPRPPRTAPMAQRAGAADRERPFKSRLVHPDSASLGCRKGSHLRKDRGAAMQELAYISHLKPIKIKTNPPSSLQ